MHPVDREDAGPAVGGGVELADEPVAVQDRQRVVPPAPLRGRLVHLQLVLVPEDLKGTDAVVHQPVERGKQRGAASEVSDDVPVEVRRVHSPPALDALDLGGLARLPDDGGLYGSLGAGLPRDADGREPSPVPFPLGLRRREDRVVGVDPFGEVPQPLPAPAAGDRDLAARHHEFKEPGDVLVVGPAGGLPWLHARIGQFPRLERTAGGEPGQDVAPAPVVGGDPVADEDLPVTEFARARPNRHVRPVEGEVLRGAQDGPQLDDALSGDRRLQVIGVVGRPEPRPGDEVGARSDRADRVELEHRQPPDRGEQVRRPLAGQHLGAHGNPPRVLPAELVHRGHGDEATPGRAGSFGFRPMMDR